MNLGDFRRWTHKLPDNTQIVVSGGDPVYYEAHGDQVLPANDDDLDPVIILDEGQEVTEQLNIPFRTRIEDSPASVRAKQLEKLRSLKTRMDNELAENGPSKPLPDGLVWMKVVTPEAFAGLAYDALGRFSDAFREYGDSSKDVTGLAGQWADLYRKVMKLKAPFWEGDPRLVRENERDVLNDLIGHALLALEMLERGATGGR